MTYTCPVTVLNFLQKNLNALEPRCLPSRKYATLLTMLWIQTKKLHLNVWYAKRRARTAQLYADSGDAALTSQVLASLVLMCR